MHARLCNITVNYLLYIPPAHPIIIRSLHTICQVLSHRHFTSSRTQQEDEEDDADDNDEKKSLEVERDDDLILRQILHMLPVSM